MKRGGKRDGAGRKNTTTETNFRVYKAPSKRTIAGYVKTGLVQNMQCFMKPKLNRPPTEKVKEDITEKAKALEKSELNNNHIFAPVSNVEELLVDTSSNSFQEVDKETIVNIVKAITNKQGLPLTGDKIPFFQNGSLAKIKERKSRRGPNFTCAPDSILAVLESLVLSPAGEPFLNLYYEDEVVKEVALIVK